MSLVSTRRLLGLSRAAGNGSYVGFTHDAFGTVYPGLNPGQAHLVDDPSGTYGTAVVFGDAGGLGMGNSGTPAGQFAPLGVYQRFGDWETGTGVAVLKTTQGFSVTTSYYGPTTDNTMEGANATVVLAGTLPSQEGGGPVTAFTQAVAVTGFEADLQVEGPHSVSAYTTTLAGRTEMVGTGHSAAAYGCYVYANTAMNDAPTDTGTIDLWRGFFDVKYNPATGAASQSESVHGVNRITSEQSFKLTRSNVGGVFQADLAGANGAEATTRAFVRIQQPSPSNTTAIADGAFTINTPLMTTATAPAPEWIGRSVTNANVPSTTRVKSYYGTGPYTVVLDTNATATASAQAVTIAEQDLIGLRIVQGASGLARPIEIWANSGSNPVVYASRTGTFAAQGGLQAVNSSNVLQGELNSSGLLHYAVAGSFSTGAGSAALGANCPASTLTAPNTWAKLVLSDGTTGFFPVWK